MGYMVSGQCMDTAQSAAALACGAYPVSAAGSDAVHTWSCNAAAADGSSLSLERTSSDGATAVQQQLPVSFPTCDAGEVYRDQSLLFSIILAAVAMVWAAKTFWYRLVANQ